MLFKPFVLIAVALSAFQAQAAPTDPSIHRDLMKVSEQASGFNVAVKAVPGPGDMSKKIAEIHKGFRRLTSATKKTSKDIQKFQDTIFSDPDQEKISNSWTHIAQSEVDTLRQLLSMEQMLLSGKAGPKRAKMILQDLSRLQDASGTLANAIIARSQPSHRPALTAAKKQLDDQFARTSNFGSPK
ncbi:hypothetical protein V501_03509 [Pseudogymnoascus sp. VKM F-4519 (FW-2642)]|nr:hypothetical protein V501_03509 [Pseudogymnoascus sp. VKM F-4519 (FW-2642)]